MVLVLAVKPAYCPDDIADVGAYAKIGDPANIDGNLHRSDLTTKDTRQHKGKLLSQPDNDLGTRPFRNSKPNVPAPLGLMSADPCREPSLRDERVSKL